MLGVLKTAGAVGLLLGLVGVPLLGTAAAIGLVLYFLGALTAHLRGHDRHVGGAVFFLLLTTAAFTTRVGYHHS
jgi:hypothetical protein